jgi:aspartyl protease family protein
MRWANVIIVAGLAVVVGWLMPAGGLDTSARRSVVDAGAASTPDGGSDSAADAASDVVLVRQPDGHYYADVDVNNTEVQFIVDTGSTGIALTGDDAQSLGLSWTNDELVVVGSGAGGKVYGKRVTLASVQLGGIQSSNIDAVIVPTGLHISLLGQSFLSKAASVKIENGRMTIG